MYIFNILLLLDLFLPVAHMPLNPSYSASDTTYWAIPRTSPHTPTLTQMSSPSSQAPTAPHQATAKAAPLHGSSPHSALAAPTPAIHTGTMSSPRSGSGILHHTPPTCLGLPHLAETLMPLGRQLPAQMLSLPCCGFSGLYPPSLQMCCSPHMDANAPHQVVLLPMDAYLAPPT